jgi:hypothetical protein
VLVNWIRSRADRQKEPTGQHCTGCRTAIAGTTDDELRTSGGVFLAGAGWFCGPRCERQYRLRFRIQPATTPGAGSQAAAPLACTPTARPQSPVTDAQDPETPGRRSAADALADALRARRRSNGGV